MAGNTQSRRLEIEAIVVGYAMSRLDQNYLALRRLGSWRRAFEEASLAIDKPPASFKNLRDEFDPIHPNPRAGWHGRPLRANRQRVLDELSDVSDDALMELVTRIFAQDETAIAEAIDSLAVVTRVAHNVAERLLTGRRAEEFFLGNCDQIVGAPLERIIDMRNSARGYDFGMLDHDNLAIEVKGLKEARGVVQFTDREWIEASVRGRDYWLVVIGNLASNPVARLYTDPHSTLIAHCRFHKTVQAVWQSTVSINPRI